ncbi:MAG: hypothetical protein KGK10_06900 [Rhodospirillales bacterium]|nr:hypothetical protein [Rhodospirillales bacterium]
MLRIIGSGFGRTGTQALKLALNELGFGPCHHMDQMLGNPAMLAPWQAVARGETPDWAAMFPGYVSQVDWPGAALWPELAAAFPDAKVIHTERPEEDWWRSFSATIGSLLPHRADAPDAHRRAVLEMAHDLIVPRSLGGLPITKERAIAAYRRNNAAVRAAIAPERLLVFYAGLGWEPLCTFLGVAVPSTPFPRINSTAEFRAHAGLDRAPA